SELGELAPRPLLHRGRRQGARRLAARRGDRRALGLADASVLDGARLLRRLPPGELAGKPAAIATRLLRGAHVPTDRQGRRLPRRLAAVAKGTASVTSPNFWLPPP